MISDRVKVIFDEAVDIVFGVVLAFISTTWELLALTCVSVTKISID